MRRWSPTSWIELPREEIEIVDMILLVDVDWVARVRIRHPQIPGKVRWFEPSFRTPGNYYSRYVRNGHGTAYIVKNPDLSRAKKVTRLKEVSPATYKIVS